MKIKDIAIPFIFYISLILFWEVSIVLFDVPEFILPPPSEILKELILKFPILMKHTYITCIESVLGFFLGVTFALITSILMTYSRVIETSLYPLLIVTQTTPKVAIAPLLIIWLGFAILPKIIISAVVSFFPLAINTLKGLKSVEHELLELMDSYGASKTETLLKVKIPNALPYIFAGLKIGITLSVIGAVVGEFVGSDMGLGYYLMQASANLDTTLMFAVIISLSLLGIFLHSIVQLAENFFLHWHSSEIDI